MWKSLDKVGSDVGLHYFSVTYKKWVGRRGRGEVMSSETKSSHATRHSQRHRGRQVSVPLQPSLVQSSSLHLHVLSTYLKTLKIHIHVLTRCPARRNVIKRGYSSGKQFHKEVPVSLRSMDWIFWTDGQSS